MIKLIEYLDELNFYMSSGYNHIKRPKSFHNTLVVLRTVFVKIYESKFENEIFCCP